MENIDESVEVMSVKKIDKVVEEIDRLLSKSPHLDQDMELD